MYGGLKQQRRAIHGFGPGDLPTNDEIMAGNRGIELDVFKDYISISHNEAIKKYLGEESQRALEKRGLYFPIKAERRSQKLTEALAFLGNPDALEEYRDEFYQTDEGRLWYDCNRKSQRDLEMIQNKNWLRSIESSERLKRGQRKTSQRNSGRRFIG